MSVVLILVGISVAMAAAFLTAFAWAVRDGQYEDTCTPAMRVLVDEQEAGASERAPDVNSKTTEP